MTAWQVNWNRTSFQRLGKKLLKYRQNKTSLFNSPRCKFATLKLQAEEGIETWEITRTWQQINRFPTCTGERGGRLTALTGWSFLQFCGNGQLAGLPSSNGRFRQTTTNRFSVTLNEQRCHGEKVEQHIGGSVCKCKQCADLSVNTRWWLLMMDANRKYHRFSENGKTNHHGAAWNFEQIEMHEMT